MFLLNFLISALREAIFLQRESQKVWQLIPKKKEQYEMRSSGGTTERFERNAAS